MSNKTKLALLTGLISLVLFSGAAWAMPSIPGPTGLISIPTADVVQPGQFNMAGFVVGDDVSVVINGAPIPNLEVGIGMENGGDSIGYLNAKYQVVPETKDFPGLAAGAIDIADSTRRSVYVVASKMLPEFGFRGHIGIQTPGDPLFAGVSKVLNTVSVTRPGESSFALQTTVVAELRGSDPSVGLRLRLTPNFALHASYLDLRTGVIGLSYNGWF